MCTLNRSLFLGCFLSMLLPLHSQGQEYMGDSLVAPLPGLEPGSKEAWESLGRQQVLELFRSQVYGRMPGWDPIVEQQVVLEDPEALQGRALMKEVDLVFRHKGRELDFRMLIFLPADAPGPVPLFLGLNFYGNHTVHPDPGISIVEHWVGNRKEYGISENRSVEAPRGVCSSRWPLERILERGYGLATICYNDIDPDHDDAFRNGIHGLMEAPGARSGQSWGSISAWAWGLSRALDYLETDRDVDATKVAVLGHSRLGKTALWAGAEDERFALVISNNSGCGGAALSRRPYGERLSRINKVFPHWFAGNFHSYGDREGELPVDQHMLLALVAPRPLYVASAEDDAWADPRGEYLSLYHGSRAWEVYGLEPLTSKDMPGVDSFMVSGKLGYHIRSGKHDLTPWDWERYLDFADEQFR